MSYRFYSSETITGQPSNPKSGVVPIHPKATEQFQF
jgi:hypothetical protein